jgi:pimeloyl-ACP methyl ester carboxylesterase
VSAAPTGRRWLAKLAAAAAILPDSTLVTIPAGHLVHAARPGEFVAAVFSWLDGWPPPPRSAMARGAAGAGT